MKQLIKNLATTCISIIILTMAACKKDKNESDKADITSKLISKNWKMAAVSVSPAFAGTGNPFFKAQLDDCTKDNVYAFFEDGYFSFVEGATKCNTTDVQTIDGGWHYEDNSKVIQFAIPPLTGGLSDIYNFTITTFTAIQLSGTMSHTIDGVSYTGSWTFTNE